LERRAVLLRSIPYPQLALLDKWRFPVPHIESHVKLPFALAQMARLDTCVTVVDADSLLANMGRWVLLSK